MPLNNELAAVRGEAAAAEDNVLWQLTGQVIDNLEDIQSALDNVSGPGVFTALPSYFQLHNLPSTASC